MNLQTKLDPRLWDAIRASYENRNFTGAILDAMYFLSDLVRERTGLESDGVALVGQAFGGNSPKLKVSPLQTESDWNVQRGVEQLLRGMYQTVRNPRSHGKIVDGEDDSLAIVLFVNYLVKLIGQSKSPFSKTEFVSRVFDPDFVASERYADLLVSEIPAKKRLEIFLDVYRDKSNGKGENLKFFFAALLKQLEGDDKRSVYECISKELQQTDDDSTIKMIIHAFDSSLWPSLDESTRLRTENKLIRSIGSGVYLKATNQCKSGWLGTWATGLLSYFTLKAEALRAISGRLSSSSDAEQDYVFQFFFLHIDALADKPPRSLERALIKGLLAGDERFSEALQWSVLWEGSKWSPDLNEAIKNFQAAESTPDLKDEDIPF